MKFSAAGKRRRRSTSTKAECSTRSTNRNLSHRSSGWRLVRCASAPPHFKMNAQLFLSRDETHVKTPSLVEPRRSFRELVQPLDELAGRSVNLIRRPLPEFEMDSAAYYIPRYLFIGPKGGGEPIRVGIFAGTSGLEPEGTIALREFVERLELTPAMVKDYCLFLYPLLNP